MDTVGSIKISKLSRSSDFNPIRNIFDYVKRELRNQAFEKNTNNETTKQFSIRVKHTFENTPTKYIDKTIISMRKRMSMVIKSKEQRIKSEIKSQI